VFVIIIIITIIAWSFQLWNALSTTWIRVVKNDGQSDGKYITCSENEADAIQE
jgi:hypothetical protein